MNIVAIQMDDPREINPRVDNTYALALEAQRRGYRVFCYQPGGLALTVGKVTANGEYIKFSSDFGNHIESAEESTLDLAEAKFVLIRQNPPFNMEYIATTYILERLPKSTRVINEPKAVRDLHEKLSPFMFPEFIPPTLVTKDKKQIKEFRQEHGDLVIKPLSLFEGVGVFYLKKDDKNIDSVLEMHAFASKEPVIVQKFLEGVYSEEKRILTIGDKIAGYYAKAPGEGTIRNAFFTGGKILKAELSEREREIGERVAQFLSGRGVIFSAIDIISGFITEINITSPGSLRQHDELTGSKLIEEFWNMAESGIWNTGI